MPSDSVMDFPSLLSRGYRPADLSRIVPKERPKDFLKKDHHNHEGGDHRGDKKEGSSNSDDRKAEHNFAALIGTTAGVSEDRFLSKLERDEKANRLVCQLVMKTPIYRKYLRRDDDENPKEEAAARLEWSTKMMGDNADLRSYAPKIKWVSPLASALSLSSPDIDNSAVHSTSTVTIEEITEDENTDGDDGNGNRKATDSDSDSSSSCINQEKSKDTAQVDKKSTDQTKKNKKEKNPFASSFHQVELMDWESNIDWQGFKEPSHNKSILASMNDNTGANKATPHPSSTSNASTTTIDATATDAMSLLEKRRNPFLENISFEKLISWTGDPDEALRKARSEPLILELGVAGRSVAKYVLPNHRPTPYAKSNEYQARLGLGDGKSKGARTNGAVRSTAELNRGTLHADKEELQRFVESRQIKRRQMAKDKTNRVKDAMGTLSLLGRGRGRTITSSLMGPGGTERTGRPARHVGASSHEHEYIEQLEMITNHTLVKNPSKIMLREYNRPKLPGTIVQTSLSWQFCIRYNGPSAADKQKKPETNSASSYHSMIMGTYAGAVSKTKLRTEADLTPTEGKLVFFEYCEERPPLQLTKAMASKIITYYRGDKSKCPVSAGGGDRPTRRKRQANNNAGLGAEKKAGADGANTNSVDKPPRLFGPNTETSITDWVGKAPKRSKDDRKNERENYNILPEGVTEILHQKAHGPFIGEIEEGQSVTGLISNLFVAPIFQHKPEPTDFLMIVGRNSGASVAGRAESLSVVLRDMPSSMYTVGQTEPRTRVYAPNTQGEKNFTGPLLSYQIAKVLTRSEMKDGHGLDFETLGHRTFPKLGSNGMRQRIKHVALYDKNTQIWTAKRIGQDDYPGVEALGKQLSPEGVVAWEVADSAKQRMNDLGIHQLYAGSHATASVGVTMFYLAGQMISIEKLANKVANLRDTFKSNKAVKPLQRKYYEEAANELEIMSNSLKQRHDVAKFIHEELQLAPWHVTGEFTDVHVKGDGSGMMKLTGLGDPSGIKQGFSFLRADDSKANKHAGPIGQTAEMKKITGTSDDLRKLTMKQMGNILKKHGMPQKQIDTLKRWDRVHVIRDISTMGASDGVGGGLERFARKEKINLNQQKKEYTDRIQVIWKSQIDALSSRPGDGRAEEDNGDAQSDGEEAAQQKKEAAAKDDSDDSDDDDFLKGLEQDLIVQSKANQLVAGQSGGDASLGQLHLATQDQAINNDARDLAAFQRQRNEERAAQEGMTSHSPTRSPGVGAPQVNRKVIRQRVTKTYPTGHSITVFKFIVKPEEVGQNLARMNREEYDPPKKSYVRPDYMPDEKQIGHAMFSDEDDFEFTTRGSRSQGTKRKVGGRRGRAAGRTKKKDLQFGKLKSKVTKEQRIKKRKREEDEMEVYSSFQRRQGTSNRKERGSIRDRRPHVIFANKLESIRGAAESRPSASAFHKPVSRRAYPTYYEMISHPMDMATIKSKIEKYEYRSAESLLKDFDLIKSNAIKFNGAAHSLAVEASAIYDMVKSMIESNKAELSHLEQAVADQMNTQPKKKSSSKKSSTTSAGAGDVSQLGSWSAADINLDDLSDDSD
ncbi:unnamed protein product [Pseudo-nitzschia multistriata]|uniref:Bromo domain-containing protein n=1 Tax=Pseudo-nitzschia multistriata TaxID=183589 RepID=A0A448ZCQ6_9STRA|nr:unnamed protein product [Pseudo-nitzschia multistriata]